MTSFPHTLEDTLVSIKDVSLQFGDTVVLRSITQDVLNIVRPGMDQGQVIGILGPSGVGKTQFSRILAGLQEPTTGSVSIATQVTVGGMPDGTASPVTEFRLTPVKTGMVGMVYQNYPLFRWRRVLGNLMVALENTKLSKAERRDKAMHYLQTFGLADKAKHFPDQLSGGQKQRVSIIQALLRSGHYLIMDEPFTGLDPVNKDLLCELINQVSTLDERNTIFVVAHDIGALVSISDCLWLFGRDRDEQGEIVPGAYIKARYNLIERGLAWQPDISLTNQFHDFVREVKGQFRSL